MKWHRYRSSVIDCNYLEKIARRSDSFHPSTCLKIDHAVSRLPELIYKSFAVRKSNPNDRSNIFLVKQVEELLLALVRPKSSLVDLQIGHLLIDVELKSEDHREFL